MSPETAALDNPQPAGMSEISRIAGVFFEPKKAFADTVTCAARAGLCRCCCWSLRHLLSR